MRLRWTTLAAKDLYRIVQRNSTGQLHRCRSRGNYGLRWLQQPEDLSQSRPCRANRRHTRIDFFRAAVHSRLSPEDQVVEVLRLYHAAQDWP
jgi:plasmid stabilization system protein ParE